MEIFKQNQLLKRIIFVLVTLNLVLIALVLFGPSKNDRQRGEGNNEKLILTLKKELSLTNQQCEEMRAIRNKYFEEETRLRTLIRAERDSMNEVLFCDSVNTSLANSFAIKISNYMYETETLRVRQAQELMTICNPDQRKQFNRLHRDIKDYFKPIKNEERPPR